MRKTRFVQTQRQLKICVRPKEASRPCLYISLAIQKTSLTSNTLKSVQLGAQSCITFFFPHKNCRVQTWYCILNNHIWKDLLWLDFNVRFSVYVTWFLSIFLNIGEYSFRRLGFYVPNKYWNTSFTGILIQLNLDTQYCQITSYISLIQSTMTTDGPNKLPLEPYII